MLSLDIYKAPTPAAIPAAAAPVTALTPAKPVASDKGDDKDWSFSDFVDFINPLQHIPLVNYAYRAITGDETPKAAVQVAGGALFGGAIGAIASLVTAGIEGAAGESIPQMAANLFGDDVPDKLAVASAASPATNPVGTTATTSMQAAAAKLADSAQTAQASEFVQNLQKGITGAKTYPAAFNAPQRSPLHDQMANMLPAAMKTDLADNGSNPDDFSKKMIDAMDRYQKMQQATTPAAGMTANTTM